MWIKTLQSQTWKWIIRHESRGQSGRDQDPHFVSLLVVLGTLLRDARHFAGNHLTWFVIPQAACWECGSNRVQSKQLQKHLLHEHNLRIDNLDAKIQRIIPFFVTQMEALLMSIATDLNLSCLQDLVHHLQRQDLRPRNYTLSPHFHNAVVEFCDRNHLPQPETMELHPPTHVSVVSVAPFQCCFSSVTASELQTEGISPLPGWQR